MLAGVISDTHGLLRPEALDALRGVDCIIHAGDIGGPEVLVRLAELAPVHAIRGNNDREQWADALPDTRLVMLGDVSIFVIHDATDLAADQLDPAVRVVISGHSHAPKAHVRDGRLYLNPGSAGPRRFRLPVSVAHLEVRHTEVLHKFVDLSEQPRG